MPPTSLTIRNLAACTLIAGLAIGSMSAAIAAAPLVIEPAPEPTFATANTDAPLERLRMTALATLETLNEDFRRETDPEVRANLAREITRTKVDLEARNAALRIELGLDGGPSGLRGSPPDLLGVQPAGWDAVALPRATNDTNIGFGPLSPAVMPGNIATSFFNAAYMNQGGSPTMNIPQQWLDLSGDLLYTIGGTNVNPGQTKYAVNMGPHSIKGGRHTLHLITDWQDDEAESDETNNEWSSQYLWSPTVLSADVPYTSSLDPPATSPGWGPWYNAEGFQRWTNTQFMHAYAVMPTASSKDVDVRLNIQAPTQVPKAGFGAHEAWSSDPAGEIDFVIIDRWSTGAGNFWASVLTFEQTFVTDKVVEWDEDTHLAGPVGTFGPFTLGAGNLIETYDWGSIGQGNSYRIDVEVLSGNADIGLSVYDSSTLR